MKLELRIIEKEYVEKPDGWVSHRRSKNYIAKITGKCNKYGLKREFLERVRVGQRTYFKLEDFSEGEVYEIRCIYYTGSWHAQPRLQGFFIVEKITDNAVILHEITEEEVIKRIKQKYKDTFEKAEIEKKIEEERAEIERIKKEIEEKKKLLTDLQEIKQKLHEEKQMILIDIDEVKKIKEELKSKIIEISKRIVKTGSQGKYGYTFETKFNERKIKIKENDNGIKYVYIDGVYIISEYKEVGLRTLYSAYKILCELEKKMKKEIQKIKQEVEK